MKILVLLFVFSIGSATFSHAQYMSIKVQGMKQGAFKGESNRSGFIDKMDILSYFLDIKSPKDASSGQSSGKRQYSPIIIWKAAGAASPQFLSALITNEQLRTVIIEFYKPDPVFGNETLAYTVELEKASLAGYSQLYGTPNTPEFKATAPGMYDQIKLVFEKIVVTDAKTKTTANDTWGTVN